MNDFVGVYVHARDPQPAASRKQEQKTHTHAQSPR